MATKSNNGVAKTATSKRVNTKIQKYEEKPQKVLPNFFLCTKCGDEYKSLDDFVYSQSELYAGWEHRLPICKKCMDDLYNHYVDVYSKISDNPDAMALRRICQQYDMFYSEKILQSAMKKVDTKTSLISAYTKIVNLIQYRGKTYDTTLDMEREVVITSIDDIDDEVEEGRIDKQTIKFFGTGFSNEDYEFLKEQYDDWTARHECESKSQEEVFKNICFKQLELLKARRAGLPTKDLDKSFQEYLGTANLQPKQNTASTMSAAQTMGTLIDKWENTRPLPEIDEQLQDVDKIGLYLDVFFRGHLAKMMGLKNGLSNLYTKFISKFTVNKPEYNEDEDSEVLFDAIFGNGDISETPIEDFEIIDD